MFNKSEKKIILEIAKNAIKEAILGIKIIDRDRLIQSYPFLKEEGAVFVTINEFNSLRGCIGSLVAYRSLIDDIISNAKSAALNDPRFKPISKDELDNLKVEVSILTPPVKVEYRNIEDLKSKIEPSVDGVILELNGYRATYLPSVWEQVGDFDLFFDSLCQKAGLSGNCLLNHPTIYKYQAVKVQDE